MHKPKMEIPTDTGVPKRKSSTSFQISFEYNKDKRKVKTARTVFKFLKIRTTWFFMTSIKSRSVFFLFLFIRFSELISTYLDYFSE